MNSTLRAHQEKALLLLKKSIAEGHTRPLVQAPTGFGKTILAAAMVSGALEKGNRVMFVVPAISLIDQTVDAFRAEGIRDIGVVQADHPLTDYSKPVQVASIQTVSRRQISRLPDVNIVIVDEAHRWFKFYDKWFTQWNAIPFIGLSATPWTKGLGKHYDDLIIASTTQELIDSGYLSDFKVFAPTHPDLSKVRTVAGDYHEGDLSEVMGDSRLVCDIVKFWKEHGQDRPTLVFAVDRAHAKMLQSDFLGEEIPTGYVDAYTPLEEREIIRKKFHTGEIQVVCNVGCLTTGVDWDVRCIVLARPTKSEILFVQMIGRGLRTAEGKDHCLIFDHSDTHIRLGFVTDICHETLDGGKHQDSITRKKQEPLPKECPSCHFLKPAKVHKCPSCGFAPEKQSDIEVGTGKLAEMKRREKGWIPTDKEKFMGELRRYAFEKRYKDGWCENQYRNMFGVWPRKYRYAPMRPPSEQTLNWIKYQQIKYAKSLEKQKRLEVA